MRTSVYKSSIKLCIRETIASGFALSRVAHLNIRFCLFLFSSLLDAVDELAIQLESFWPTHGTFVGSRFHNVQHTARPWVAANRWELVPQKGQGAGA